MRYESYNSGLDEITSHYVYTSKSDCNEIDLLDFLEKNDLDIDKVEYVEYESIPGRHIFHDTK